MSARTLSELPRRTRRAKSCRPAIAAAIARRIATAEPLSIRAIIAEAGGGSTDTVREELARAGVDEAARHLQGDAIRSAAEREAALRFQLERVEREAAHLREENKSLREALRQATRPSAILEHQVSEIGREVREAVEGLRREAAHFRKLRGKSAEPTSVPDPLLQARFDRLAADNVKLLERFNRLQSKYIEKTGEDYEE